MTMISISPFLNVRTSSPPVLFLSRDGSTSNRFRSCSYVSPTRADAEHKRTRRHSAVFMESLEAGGWETQTPIQSRSRPWFYGLFVGEVRWRWLGYFAGGRPLGAATQGDGEALAFDCFRAVA